MQFYCIGGSESQSVFGVTTICLMQCNTYPSHRVDPVVDCGMFVTPLQWLCKVAGYWQELEPTVVYDDPEHPKHAQWVTCPVSRAVVKSTFVESKTSPSPKRFESESSPSPKRFESESSPSPKRFESKSKSKSK